MWMSFTESDPPASHPQIEPGVYDLQPALEVKFQCLFFRTRRWKWPQLRRGTEESPVNVENHWLRSLSIYSQSFWSVPPNPDAKVVQLNAELSQFTGTESFWGDCYWKSIIIITEKLKRISLLLQALHLSADYNFFIYYRLLSTVEGNLISSDRPLYSLKSHFSSQIFEPFPLSVVAQWH